MFFNNFIKNVTFITIKIKIINDLDKLLSTPLLSIKISAVQIVKSIKIVNTRITEVNNKGNEFIIFVKKQ